MVCIWLFCDILCKTSVANASIEDCNDEDEGEKIFAEALRQQS